MWGDIDVDEYRHYDSPANGNLHEVVPGKFVAFQGPKDLGGADYRDSARGARTFSPGFYVEILRDMGVTAVVRLNEPWYAAEALTAHGFEFHSLEFEDCTCPPDAVVEAFMQIADATTGAVAVHCKAGLGRTGTLIALYMMRTHGFTAREAMGWLRIMRPGSVIGEQQQYLCSVGAALSALSSLSSSSGSSGPADAADVHGPSPPSAAAAPLAHTQRPVSAGRAARQPSLSQLMGRVAALELGRAASVPSSAQPGGAGRGLDWSPDRPGQAALRGADAGIVAGGGGGGSTADITSHALAAGSGEASGAGAGTAAAELAAQVAAGLERRSSLAAAGSGEEDSDDGAGADGASGD